MASPTGGVGRLGTATPPQNLSFFYTIPLHSANERLGFPNLQTTNEPARYHHHVFWYTPNGTGQLFYITVINVYYIVTRTPVHGGRNYGRDCKTTQVNFDAENDSLIFLYITYTVRSIWPGFTGKRQDRKGWGSGCSCWNRFGSTVLWRPGV